MAIAEHELEELRKRSCKVGMAKSLIDHTEKSVGWLLKEWPNLNDHQRRQRLIDIREDLALAPDLS